ncbi:MAG: hypothetical protein HC875_17815 [Anaerolineales bacterium]|nr:hypothetical protein [Anaerolineales bacterium]
MSTEEPAFAAASLSDDELDALDADDLPSWLKEVQERDGRDAADSVSKPLITEFSLPLDSAGEVIEDELPGWLRDVPEETTPLEFEALEPLTETPLPQDQMVIEEDLPDWLREEEFNLDEPFEPSEPSPEILPERGISDLPDWLQEIQDEAPEEAVTFKDETPQPVTTAPSAGPAADTMVEEEGLPDWLREVEAEEEEIELPAFEAPIPAPALVPGIVAETTTTEVVDEEGLPDWLREVEAEEEVELPAFETPVTAPVPEIVTEVITTEMVIAEVVEEEAEPVAAAQPVEEVAEPETPAPVPIFEPEPVSQPIEAAPTEGGIPDWLQKLREVDEEPPVSIPAMPLPAPVQVAAPVRQAPRPVYAQAVAASPDIPADAAEQLQLARTSRDKGNLDEAVRIYDSLVSRGIYLDKIIEDMQQSIKAQPKNYLLFQVMGDAMMRDGRLQSALNAYREALARL